METLLVLRLQISAASQNKGSICPPSGEQVAWIWLPGGPALEGGDSRGGEGRTHVSVLRWWEPKV